jgi:AcrR family transcriptional regulator
MTVNEHSLGFCMRHGPQTKERIERAALRLFVEQGVAGTSIREIASAAGVSQGAMYNHYVSKEELAFSLFAQIWADMGTQLRQCAHIENSLEGKFRAKLPNPYLIFRTVIVDAIQRGEIPRQNPDLANAMVSGAVIQVIDTKIYGRIKQRLSGLAEPVAKACAAMLRP